MLISILKRYPKQSQGSGYVPGGNGSGFVPGGATGGTGGSGGGNVSNNVGNTGNTGNTATNITSNTGSNPANTITSSTGSNTTSTTGAVNTTGNITVLQTNGTQFILNGTRFIGPYHIHSDGQAYAGDATNHADGSEVLLTPIPGAGSNTGSGSYNTTLSATGPVVQTPAGQLVTPTSNVTPAGSPLPPTPNVPYSVQQEYIDNGLTFKSNNQYVIDRDSAGNMKLQISASSNQNLIIEPAIENFTNTSFINAVDTQFNYFKFPASIKAPDIPEATIDDINFNLNTADGITARYVVPYTENDQGQPFSLRPLNTYQGTGVVFSNETQYNGTQKNNWWFGGETNAAVKSWTSRANGVGVGENIDVPLYPNGLAKIPFEQKIIGNGDQLEPGTFTLTQEMIDRLRENNQTIKFRIRLQVTRPSYGLVQAITKNVNNDPVLYRAYSDGFEGVAELKLNRTMPTLWRNFYAPTDSIGVLGNPLTLNNPYGELQLDYIIDIKNDAGALDKYTVTAGGRAVDPNTGLASTFYGLFYNRDVSYWEVLVIDDPGTGYGKQTI
jgi:hypothetical protein